MPISEMHPEDIKAAIRKKYGSVSRFVEVHGLPATGVSDLLRGRTSKRVRDAIEEALGEDRQSIISDCSENEKSPHRLISAAR